MKPPIVLGHGAWGGPCHEPLPSDAEGWAQLPKRYIACVQPLFATAKAHHDRVRGMPRREVVELATGHCPMVTAPREPAALL